MSTASSHMFTLNDHTYDSSQLSPEGQQVLELLTAAQSELAKLETHQALLMAAKQQLINQLKQLLPPPVPNQIGSVGGGGGGAVNNVGQASDEVPNTSTQKPTSRPEPLPENLPEDIRAKP